MSEFEMAYLHTELFNAVQLTLTVYVSVLSGFLVLSYLAAHRLTRTMTAISLFVYAGFSATVVFGANRVLVSYAGLSREMHTFAGAGKGLAWHSTATLVPWLPEALPFAFLAAGILASIGSIVFFFHCRRVNRNAQSGAWRPKG
jgi:hypothetical protein